MYLRWDYALNQPEKSECNIRHNPGAAGAVQVWAHALQGTKVAPPFPKTVWGDVLGLLLKHKKIYFKSV